MRPHSTPTARPPRRGAILLVVLAMLALFAVLGLSFVLYAESSATAARINREAVDLNSSGGGSAGARVGNPEATAAAGLALGQMLFDASDTDPQGATSAFRGYGLVRLKYGYDRTLATNQGLSPFAGQGLIADADTQDGSGSSLTLPGVLGSITTFRSGIVNYAWQPGEKHILDPEWTKFRQAATAGNPTTATDLAITTTFTDGTRAYRNVAAPYTYPDMKDLPLAVISTIKGTQTDTANGGTPAYTLSVDVGTVLQPSYFRFGPDGTSTSAPTTFPKWVFNPTEPNPYKRLSPNAPDWTSPEGRLKILRPRPDDHKLSASDISQFPYVPPNPDGTYTGDVMNLPSTGIQRNDSLWMYPAGPIITVGSRKYTALVAPLVLDLGGRVNLSTAGNLLKGATVSVPRQDGTDHASSMGVGRWEVNPRWVFDPNTTTRSALTTDPKIGSQAALRNLLTGVNGSVTDTNSLANSYNQFTPVGGTAITVSGRYGISTGTTYPPTALALPPFDPLTALASAEYNGTLAPTGDPTLTLRTPPHYSPIDFDASTTLTGSSDVAKPVGGQYSPFPSFANTRYYDTTNKQFEFSNHPAQFSPALFPASGTAGRTFPASDLRWLATKLGGKPEDYSNAEVARLLAQQLIAGPTSTGTARYDTTKPPSSPQTLPGTGAPTGTYNPTPYGTVTDPANLTRLLVTTVANSTHRPELRVNALLPGGATGLAPLGPVDMARPLPDYRYNPTPGAAPPVWNPDNVYGPSGGTASSQLAQVQAAQAARQRFARDIFVRLTALYSDWRVATGQTPYTSTPGTSALIDGTEVFYVADATAPDFGYLRITSTLASPTETDKFKTLRQLAQLAANLVDYVDSDDISTPFVWNLPQSSMGIPFDPTSTFTATGGLQFTLGSEGTYAVFGTELPRLVLNEAYSCVVNDSTDPKTGPAGGGTGATKPIQTLFWAELHNPLGTTTTPYDPNLSGAGESPNTTGGTARLFYPKGNAAIGTTNQSKDFSPYQLQVVTSPTASPVTTALATPNNVLGAPSTAVSLQIGRTGTTVTDFTFDSGSVAKRAAVFTSTPDEQNIVRPNAGRTADTTTANQGYYVFGPKDDFPGTDIKASLRLSDPPAMPMQPAAMKVIAGGSADTDRTTALTNPHAFVLRRLANPYLPEQSDAQQAFYNPYVTVDVFDGVQVNDRVTNTSDGGLRMGFTASTTPATARRHPYAGLIASLQQQTAAPATGSPSNSFFSYNFGQDAVLRWLAHLDRQPLNPIELASVSAVPPSLVTNRFYTVISGMTPVTVYNGHTAERLFLPGTVGGSRKLGPPFPNDPSTATATDVAGGELHQAFDYLAARSPVGASAVGAPEAGRLNLNAVNHPSILRALFDPNTAATDVTSANLFEEQDVDTNLASGPVTVPGFWQKLTTTPAPTTDTAATSGTRSPSYPNLSQYPNLFDQPISALSKPWLASLPPATATQQQLQQTVLRRHDALMTGTSPTLFQNPLQNGTMTGGSIPAEAKDHVTLKGEPLHKAWNNTSTTSDTFLVVMTVSFFEVRNVDANGRVYLGQELYRDTPGDLRQKYASVVDRSNAAVEIDLTTVPGTPVRTGNQDATTPWYTATTADIVQGGYDSTGTTGTYNSSNPLTCEIEASLSGTSAALGVDASGKPIKVINPGSIVRLGFGDASLNNGEGEAFTVSAVTASPSGMTPALPSDTPGRVRLSLVPQKVQSGAATTAVVLYHPAGSVVTSVLLGNPGPQPTFSPSDARYQSLVRYFGRVNP